MNNKNITKYISIIFPIILILLLTNCSNTKTSSNISSNISYNTSSNISSNTSLNSNDKEYIKFLKRYYTASIEIAKSLDLQDDETAIKELKSWETWQKISKLRKIINSFKVKVSFPMELNYEGLKNFIKMYDIVYKMPSDMNKLSQEEEAAFYCISDDLKWQQTKPLKYFLP